MSVRRKNRGQKIQSEGTTEDPPTAESPQQGRTSRASDARSVPDAPRSRSRRVASSPAAATATEVGRGSLISAAARKRMDLIYNGALEVIARHQRMSSPLMSISTAAKVEASSSTEVPLKRIAGKLGIETRVARRLLRTGGKKPPGRWAWSTDQVPAVEAFLTEAYAKAKPR